MSTVYYKFRSQKEFATVTFDGPTLTLAELKRAIITDRNLSRETGCDLVCINAQTNEEYRQDTVSIPRNTSVLVKRVPSDKSGGLSHYVTGAAPTIEIPPQTNASTPSHISPSQAGQNNASCSGGSEEERLSAMLVRQDEQWAGNGIGRGRGGRPFIPRGPPPPGYTCHRCGEKGHYIQVCPNQQSAATVIKVKPPTGIPVIFLEKAAGAEGMDGEPGAGQLYLPDGSFARVRNQTSEFDNFFALKNVEKFGEGEESNVQPSISTPVAISTNPKGTPSIGVMVKPGTMVKPGEVLPSTPSSKAVEPVANSIKVVSKETTPDLPPPKTVSRGVSPQPSGIGPIIDIDEQAHSVDKVTSVKAIPTKSEPVGRERESRSPTPIFESSDDEDENNGASRAPKMSSSPMKTSSGSKRLRGNNNHSVPATKMRRQDI